jgi:uncharacterized membrane protein
MSARVLKLPAMLAVALAAVLSAGAVNAKADDCDRRGPRFHRSSYSFRSGGCYTPAPSYSYRSYSRGYCAPSPRYYGGGFSFSYSRGGYDRDCRPRYYSYRGCR